jgi:hypothetical protein
MLRSSKAVHENSPVVAWDSGGRPQTHGRARAFSWQVATLVARVISSGVANDCPARAWRRNSRHQPSCRFSQQARLGMKVCWMRGWSASQVRVLALVWLDRLSVITMMVPAGLAASTAASRCW